MPLKALNTEIPGCQQYTLQDWDQSYQCASAVIYWKRKARRSKTFKASATWEEPKVFLEPKVQVGSLCKSVYVAPLSVVNRQRWDTVGVASRLPLI